MTAQPDMPIDMLDRYVDGALSLEERERFETLLAADPRLRRELDLQRSIDKSLRRQFDPPMIRQPMPQQKAGRRAANNPPAPLSFPKRLAWYAAAACLAMACYVGVSVFNARFPSGPRVVDPAEVYQRLVKGGFKPEFICTTDEEFSRTMNERFGQPLLVAASPNISLIGWAYGANYSGITISDETLILMARVDGEETLVFMDRAKNDRKVAIDPASGLKLHRGQAGSYVLYELSKRESPQIIPRVYVPGK